MLQATGSKASQPKPTHPLQATGYSEQAAEHHSEPVPLQVVKLFPELRLHVIDFQQKLQKQYAEVRLY